MAPAPRAVFFDFGGTLFRYGDLRESFDALLASILARHGLEASGEAARQAYREAMGRQFARFAGRPYYRHRELFEAAHRDFLAAFGATPGSDDEVDLLYEGQNDLGLAAVQPRPCAQDTLVGLRQRGLHLAIVSNIDDDQFAPLWDRMGLAPLFDATTTSEEARSCKPDPGIFHTALAKAGNPDPQQVLFVGDSAFHDVAGARALGMTTVLIQDRDGPAPEPTPDHAIRRLSELLEIVDG